MISTHSYPWDLAANTRVCGIPRHAETTAAIFAEHVREEVTDEATRGSTAGRSTREEHCLARRQSTTLLHKQRGGNTARCCMTLEYQRISNHWPVKALVQVPLEE